MIFSLDDMIAFLPSLLQGAMLTIAVSLLSFALALVLGLAIGIARISHVPPLRVVTACYIQFIRGTPLLLQLFFIYYVLPYAGIVLTPFVSGAMGLTLNYAAYMAEVFRSGIQAIRRPVGGRRLGGCRAGADAADHPATGHPHHRPITWQLLRVDFKIRRWSR
jgi:polar amino acid transport system permease protein